MKMDHRFLRPMPSIKYLIRDEFTTALPAGAVNGTDAEPGPGTRGVTDLDSRVTIAGGQLTIAAGGSTGDRTAFWLTDAITRVAGQILAFTFTTNAGGANTIQVGFAIATGANAANAVDVGLRSLAGSSIFARRAAAGDSPKIASLSNSTTYRVYQVLRANGQFVFLKTGSTTKFLWLDAWSATTPLYFNMWHYGTDATAWDSVLAPQPRYTFNATSSDSFNRANGAPGNTDGLGYAEARGGSGLAWSSDVGTAAISGNALLFSALGGGIGITTVDTGNTDEFISVEATRAGGVVGIVTRYVDANNHIRVYHDGTDFKIDKVVGGVVTNVGTHTIAIAAGGLIKAKCDGTNVWAWYDDTDCDLDPVAVADAALQTGTKHGVYSTNTGNTFDNWNTFAINGYTDLGKY